MNEHYESFRRVLLRAASAISPQYFRLAIAGRNGEAVRERVYCYELYHQLRCILSDQQDFPFVLHGEVDKRGHDLYGDALQGRNPDFIVHIPGETGPDANLCVVEVKPCGAKSNPETKDAETLSLFLDHARYFRGIMIMYGDSEDACNQYIARCLAGYAERAETIEVLWHRAPGEGLVPIDEWWTRL